MGLRWVCVGWGVFGPASNTISTTPKLTFVILQCGKLLNVIATAHRMHVLSRRRIGLTLLVGAAMLWLAACSRALNGFHAERLRQEGEASM